MRDKLSCRQQIRDKTCSPEQACTEKMKMLIGFIAGVALTGYVAHRSNLTISEALESKEADLAAEIADHGETCKELQTLRSSYAAGLVIEL